MTASEKHLKALAEVAEKIAMEKVDQVDEPHQFSDTYQQRKKTFLNEVAADSHQKKYRKRLIGIAVSLLIGIPTTAFAAKKLYDIVVKKENYEMSVSVKGQGDKEKKQLFYKLSLGYLPENMEKDGESNKYSYTDNYAKGGFSFILWKVNQEADFSALSVDEYQAVDYGKNKGFLLKKDNPGKENMFSRHVYLMFEEEGYMVEGYIGDDVPDGELGKVLTNLSLEVTSKELASSFVDYDQYQADFKEEPDPSEYKIVGLAKDSPQLLKIGEVVKTNMGSVEKGKLELTVESVEVRETIANVDTSNLNEFPLEYLKENQMMDEVGNLLPYKRHRYTIGDGKTTIDELIETQTVQPKFIYLTVALENKTNHSLEDVYFQNQLTLLVEKENKWTYDFEDYQEQPSAFLSEVAYLDSHGEGKSFYKMPTIEPLEKRTVQVGYFVDEDKLSNMFLSIFYSGHSGLVEDLGASDRWWVDIRQ